MTKYVALLRGIGPGNPNMRNDKLRGVLEELGLKNVQSVISSGNIVFESGFTDTVKLEAMIEAAWPDKLGFTSTTLVRSQQQLEALIKANPFGNLEHSPSSYLLTTFFKHPTKPNLTLPYQPEGKTYRFIGMQDNTLFSVTNNTVVKTTDLMTWMEKQFGKEITSRTWLTVHRILKKLQQM